MKLLHLPFRSAVLTGMLLLGAVCSLDAWGTTAEKVSTSQVLIAQTDSSDESSDSWKLIRQISLILGIIGVLGIAIVIFQKGIVVIGENEVGIKYKRFNLNPFHPKPPRRQLIARNKEAGYQPDTLDDGWHWLLPWVYTIYKEPVVRIPPGEIALVFAQDGKPIPKERILAKVVECDNFQDASAFLKNDGERGRQLSILTGGTSYRINTKLFTVITCANVTEHDPDLEPEDLLVYRVDPDKIGIVTTSDGAPLNEEKIAGSIISGHDNFQNPQKFIDKNGYRGLQEEVLPSGDWNLNPWFVKVEQVPLTEIREGTVGVVVSLIGKDAPKKDVGVSCDQASSIEKGYELVEKGDRGVWKEPLGVGTHPINTKVRRVVVVPTYQITLDWSNDKNKPDDNYDKKLGTLKLRLKDRLLIEIVVRQRFRVPKEKASLMISQIGSPGDMVLEQVSSSGSTTPRYKSIRDLIVRVLEPTIENYFINAVHDCEAEDFYLHRDDQQKEAARYLKEVLTVHGVEAIDTLIGEIDLPDEFDNLEIKRKLEEKKRNLIEQEMMTEELNQRLAYLQAVTTGQGDVARSQMSLEIAKWEAQVQIQKAIAEARAMREQGQAQIDVEAALRRSIIDALGQRAYIEIQKLKELTNLKMPSMISSSGGTSSGLIIDTLLASIMENLTGNNSEAVSGTLATQVAALFSVDLDGRTNQQHNNQFEDSSVVELENTSVIASLPESYIVCNSCETQNPQNHKFCFKCGEQLTNSSASK
jgi:uncharacterized membrane protein YqiK